MATREAVEAAAAVLCRRQFCRLQNNREVSDHDREVAAEMIRVCHEELGRAAIRVGEVRERGRQKRRRTPEEKTKGGPG